LKSRKHCNHFDR